MKDLEAVAEKVKEDRKQRLALRLRENLHKRKAQARARLDKAGLVPDQRGENADAQKQSLQKKPLDVQD